MSMSNKRLIFYAVFALFHIVFVIVALTMPASEDYTAMFKYLKWIPVFKFASLFGLALIIADVVWSFIIHRDAQKEKNALTQELTHLKAKLFDLQEGKNTPAQKTPKP
jgi:hypothetical protein